MSTCSRTWLSLPFPYLTEFPSRQNSCPPIDWISITFEGDEGSDDAAYERKERTHIGADERVSREAYASWPSRCLWLGPASYRKAESRSVRFNMRNFCSAECCQGGDVPSAAAGSICPIPSTTSANLSRNGALPAIAEGIEGLRKKGEGGRDKRGVLSDAQASLKVNLLVTNCRTRPTMKSVFVTA